METTTETTVERELAIDASPETVWEFLVDPEKLARWFGSHGANPRSGSAVRHDWSAQNVPSGASQAVTRNGSGGPSYGRQRSSNRVQ